MDRKAMLEEVNAEIRNLTTIRDLLMDPTERAAERAAASLTAAERPKQTFTAATRRRMSESRKRMFAERARLAKLSLPEAAPVAAGKPKKRYGPRKTKAVAAKR